MKTETFTGIDLQSCINKAREAGKIDWLFASYYKAKGVCVLEVKKP